MRYIATPIILALINPALIILVSVAGAFAQRPSNAPVAATAAPSQDDTLAIRRIEDDLLKAERTTDPAIIERVLADDFVSIRPHGAAPGNKADWVRNFQEHAGQAPPYAVETRNLKIYLVGDSAVAAYVKVYTANENGNVAHEDDTHVFVKDGGVWKLKIAGASNCMAED